jgi:Hsp70 protein
MVWAVMSDPLGLSVGTTNLVAARVGNQPVTRRSVLTLPNSTQTINGFVERVGDRVPLVTPDGKSYHAEQLLVSALEAMVQVGGGASPDIAIAVPAYWGPSTVWALQSALGGSPTLSQTGEPVRLISDAVAALTALQANPGISVNGVVALLDFGGSGTSITLADAASSFAPIGETMRYPDFSGDLIDQALLSHVLDNLGGDVDPAGTAAVGSLTRLRDECQLAKERLSADTATQLVIELPGNRADIRVTRNELQDLIRPSLDGVIAALDEMTGRAGAAPNGLAAIAIVGGGAGIPFVTQRLSEHSRLPVVTTPQPALNAAVGAALFAAFGADAGAEAPTGVSASTAAADAPTGAASAATDSTAAAAVLDGPLPDEPGSATFRALAWSQEEGGDEPVPYTGENPYELSATEMRPSVQYVSATGPIAETPRRSWPRMASLVIGVAAIIAIVTVGGVAYALTGASESTKATEESHVDPPKQPAPEPPSPPKQESPEPPPPSPPPPPPPPPPSEVTVTSEAPPPPPPSPTWTPTTTEHTTTTRTTTTTPPTTTTTSPTITTTEPTTTTTITTTTTTSTTPSMTTSYIRVPFVPVPVPIQVPNTGAPQAPAYEQQPPYYQQQPPYYQQQPVYPQSPWG